MFNFIKPGYKITLLWIVFIGIIFDLVFFIVQPIHSLKFNVAIIFFVLGLIAWLFYVCRKKRKIVIAMIVLLAFPFTLLLNQSQIDRDALRNIYVGQLRSFVGTGYVWGGEGFMGIDCSGLPRKSIINALSIYGIKNLNGRALTKAAYYWWNDASALELIGGYRGETSVSANSYTINGMIDDALPGDMAVTKNGVHVMVYLEIDKIIQADPGRAHVVIDNIPANESWYDEPVKLVKWNVL